MKLSETEIGRLRRIKSTGMHSFRQGGTSAIQLDVGLEERGYVAIYHDEGEKVRITEAAETVLELLDRQCPQCGAGGEENGQ